MSMSACKKYIEEELKKGTKKSEIEEHLRKNHREGLWRDQLDQYPEAENFKKNKLLNYTLFIYVCGLLVLNIVSQILYYSQNPDKRIFILLIYRNIWIIIPIIILYSIKKGQVIGYLLSMIYPLFFLIYGQILDFIIASPIIIFGIILKRRMHPYFNFFAKLKSKFTKT